MEFLIEDAVIFLSQAPTTLSSMLKNLPEKFIKQVLSAWVVHDFNHIYQVSRVIAKQYDQEVGPFKPYISILNKS